jgi:pimeloyl-ACP methyl ester carboxylesterase
MPVARAILLPGAVLPAELAYSSLIAALGPDVEAVAKDLELYATPQPPVGYSLDLEIDGLLREADALGWETFHLVGYSGGGAASLAFAAASPDRLASLALLEPAWAGRSDQTSVERAFWLELEQLDRLSAEDFMAAFVQLAVKPGVEVPATPDDPPPWMANRPAGIRALLRTFRRDDLDPDALPSFERPVYYALGGLSNPDQYREIADRLGGVFPDFELEVYEDRHHFDPPHRIEPERLARSLQAVWERA